MRKGKGRAQVLPDLPSARKVARDHALTTGRDVRPLCVECGAPMRPGKRLALCDECRIEHLR